MDRQFTHGRVSALEAQRTDSLYQPRLAELLARELRRGILRGDVPDGALLPAQDELCNRFKVGKVAVREALRILQNEGLVTVKRGNVGGAVVHYPEPNFASRMLAMVMEARDVRASHLATALQELEPLCAAMCAGRSDRTTHLVPQLYTLVHESESVLSDPMTFTRLTRKFHELLVSGCGNGALVVVVGALESIWSPVAEGWASHAETMESYPDVQTRRAVVRVHERITALIAEGRADGAARLVRKHLALTQRRPLGNNPDRPITVDEGSWMTPSSNGSVI